MGFFFWLFCTILVVALVLLLFPFSVRIEFEAGERSGRALFFFFKKKIYEYEKKWGKDETSDERVESAKEEKECHPERNVVEPKDPERLDEGVKSQDESNPVQSFSTNGRESIQNHSKILETQEIVAKAPIAPKEEHKAAHAEPKIDEEKKDTPKVVASKPIEVKSSDARRETSGERQEEKDESGDDAIQEPKNQDSSKSAKPESEKKEKPKKEKPKLTDREFWTILLTPDLDARAFKYALKIIASVFSLFRIRFNDCFVEGIRTDYVTMGYIAALNGIMKAYPYVGAWDLRMDWLHEKELRAAGNVRLSITLLRIICFVLETLVLAGILAFIFWRRRAHVLKTKELPEIGFIRKKIVDFILED